MRQDRLIPGLILVMIGVLILLSNFGNFNFHWWNIFRLWPIFLVIGGVNLVFAHNKSPLATGIKIAVVIGGFALIAFGNFDNGNRWWPGFSISHDDWNDDSDSSNDDDSDSTSRGDVVHVKGNNTFNEPYQKVKEAKLNISGGATTYTLTDSTNDLFKANTTEFFGKYKYDHHMEDSVFVMDFKMKDHDGHFEWDDKNNSNEANMLLNVNPIWNINVDAGATKLNFDLTKFKIRQLSIHGGAADYEIKLGQPLAQTNVDISGGVSSVKIHVPMNAACHIATNSGLTDNHFGGFNKNSDNTYETAGFASAKNKIYISLSGGISDYNVDRY